MGTASPRRRAKTAVRVLLIGVLAVLVGVVAVFLFRRSDRPAAIRPETKPLTKQKVDVKDDIHFIKDTGGRSILDVRAARNFTDAQGLYHLAGPADKPAAGVRIESRDRNGRMKFAATATEVLYDADWTRLVFRGDVRFQLDDVTVKGSSFVYQKGTEVITTAFPAFFEGERFRGDSKRASYSLSDEQVRFFGGINLVASPWDTDPVPVIITGQVMTYAREFRTGTVRGDVRMVHGRSRGRAEYMYFAQFEDKPGFRLFEFKGGVSVDVDEGPAGGPPRAEAPPEGKASAPASDEGLFFFQGGRQRMEAGEVTFLPYGNKNWPRYAYLGGRARVEIFDDAGRQTTLTAEEMFFFYNDAWTLRDFRLSGRAGIVGEAEGRMRRMDAPSLNYTDEAGLLVAAGTAAAPARSISGGREITAESMITNLRNENFDARGDVRIVSVPRAGEARDAALFDAGRPVFMTAGFAHYDGAERRFRLGERARLWQGRESLEADDVTIFEESGDLSVLGSVRSVFFQRPKGRDEDQRVEITGGRLTRASAKGRVVFQDGCALAAGEITMKSGRLTLMPGEDGEKYRRVLADVGRVAVVQAPNEAEGDRADYDLVGNVILLTGDTVLEDREKGVVHKGGKLTFHPADGRILIENRNTERSTTIIKS